MSREQLRTFRTDIILVCATALAGAGIGADAVVVAHYSLPHRAALGVLAIIGFGASVAQGARAVRRSARHGEKDAQLEATVAYLQQPEAIRGLEAQVEHWVAIKNADALFCQHFEWGGPSHDVTANCRLCAYETNGTLADVRVDCVAHLREAHELQAAA